MSAPFPAADMQVLLEQMDADINILVLVSGKLADGTEHYAYASIPPSKYQAFKEAEAKGRYDLGNFGKILRHGSGLQPSDAVKKDMEERFGADHCFEEELLAISERLRKDFGDAQ